MAVESLGGVLPLAPLPREPAAVGPAPGGGFGKVLQGVLGENAQATAAADDAVQALATGQAQDLHTVSLAVARADLSFRLVLDLRNRLTEAYQEVMRMQV
jgi:flagellar hook-basal body complex protein FliE